MEIITKTFGLSEDEITNIISNTTKHVKENSEEFWYLFPLAKDKMCSFVHFGADKAGTKNIELLLSENELQPIVLALTHPLLRYDGYSFLSKDRKLIVTFTASPSSNTKLEGEFYFHYLGITGEDTLVFLYLNLSKVFEAWLCR